MLETVESVADCVGKQAGGLKRLDMMVEERLLLEAPG